MPTTASSPGDATERALTWIRHRGIQVHHCVADGAIEPLEHPHPRLFLVPPDGDPPTTWTPVEDWVRVPADPEELFARAQAILGRACELGHILTYIDDDDILRVGGDLTVLSPTEARVLRVLLEREGEVVERDDLARILWGPTPPEDPRALDNRVKMVRRRLRGLPLRIHTVRARGFLLERLPLAGPSPTD